MSFYRGTFGLLNEDIACLSEDSSENELARRPSRSSFTSPNGRIIE